MKRVAMFGLICTVLLTGIPWHGVRAEPVLGMADPTLVMPDPEPMISMDFKDASLKDILKVFSIQSRLNFIASQAVQDRKMTLYLDKVPLNKAMEKLFDANNLSYELDRTSDIFIVKDWGAPVRETITKIYALRYTSLPNSNIRREINKNLASGGGSTQGGGDIVAVVKNVLSANGKVVENTRTNSIIVTDIPKQFEIIDSIIAKLDVPIPEVMLEVEMLDVLKATVDKMGVYFPDSIMSLDMSANSRMTKFPFGNKAQNGQDWTLEMDDASATGWEFDPWRASHFGPTVFSFLNANFALNLIKQQTDTKTLARPRIMTLNHETAEIKIVTQETVGQSEVRQGEGTASTTTVTAERFETGVTMRVTPQINMETGEITMFVMPSVKDVSSSSLTEFNTKDPEERTTKSVITVKDGETIIIGGLIHNAFNEIKRQAPGLGDIPILGALFRHRNKDRDRERELLVFITPRIVRDPRFKIASSTPMPVMPEREQARSYDDFNRDAVVATSLNELDRY